MQLSHTYNTQYNEAMNSSVASFAPKGKTYSKTESLDPRVPISVGVQILGYELFREAIYDKFVLTFDNNLREFLRRIQTKKYKKRALARMNDIKIK